MALDVHEAERILEGLGPFHHRGLRELRDWVGSSRSLLEWSCATLAGPLALESGGVHERQLKLL